MIEIALLAEACGLAGFRYRAFPPVVFNDVVAIVTKPPIEPGLARILPPGNLRLEPLCLVSATLTVDRAEVAASLVQAVDRVPLQSMPVGVVLTPDILTSEQNDAAHKTLTGQPKAAGPEPAALFRPYAMLQDIADSLGKALPAEMTQPSAMMSPKSNRLPRRQARAVGRVTVSTPRRTGG